MTVMHVFDGRTDANEYYWFVLAEHDNSEEIILTMPRERVSDGIGKKFEAIQAAYLTERGNDPTRSAEAIIRGLEGQFGYNFWTSVIR